MTGTSRRTVQVQPEQETNPAPGAFQNHVEEQQEEEEDDEPGIVKRAKESDFTAISMQDQASSSNSSVEAESLKKYLDGDSASE